ncbi:nuclear transport factor 2 family protein [Arthrobacter sp. B3I9]|uniref:YybH family protein n=1 Tax=Arthrobacter sp. B3I9 TaxID=3042270 RepID=UPI0027D8DAFA|nr:nuclear transport factor 2 family protein [Arthrobacter sp. B3I9]
MQLDEVIDQFHQALNDFARGDPEPVKAMFSHSGDVSLANPWGPPVVGRERVSGALESAAARFKDGRVTAIDALTKHVTTDLACFLDMEHWQAKVGGGDEASPFDLRVTSIYRLEGNRWALVHRHADPITTPKAPDAVLGH